MCSLLAKRVQMLADTELEIFDFSQVNMYYCDQSLNRTFHDTNLRSGAAASACHRHTGTVAAAAASSAIATDA